MIILSDGQATCGSVKPDYLVNMIGERIQGFSCDISCLLCGQCPAVAVLGPIHEQFSAGAFQYFEDRELAAENLIQVVGEHLSTVAKDVNITMKLQSKYVKFLSVRDISATPNNCERTKDYAEWEYKSISSGMKKKLQCSFSMTGFIPENSIVLSVCLEYTDILLGRIVSNQLSVKYKKFSRLQRVEAVKGGMMEWSRIGLSRASVKISTKHVARVFRRMAGTEKSKVTAYDELVKQALEIVEKAERDVEEHMKGIKFGVHTEDMEKYRDEVVGHLRDAKRALLKSTPKSN